MTPPNVITDRILAAYLRERDELNYVIELREGYLTDMYGRRAELDRRINELQPEVDVDPNVNGGDYSF